MMHMPRPRTDRPSVPPPPTRQHRGGRWVWSTRWRGVEMPGGRRPSYRKTWHDAPEAEAAQRYRLWLAQWQADPRVSDPRSAPGAGLTLLDFATLYSDHAAKTFRVAGQQTSHATRVRLTLERLANLDSGGHPIGLRPAAEALTAPNIASFRDAAQIREDGERRARASVNDMLQVIRDATRWGAELGYLPPEVVVAVATVRNLKRGRSAAKERGRVSSVSRERVDAVLPLVTPPAAALIEIIWQTGMRPTEACCLRADRIDMTDDACWLYCPERYKGQHLDDVATRIVAIMPATQAVIRPWLTGDPGAYLFRPTGPRTKASRYTSETLRQNIVRACDQVHPMPPGLDRAGRSAWRKRHHWTTHRLRHARATEVYRSHGHAAAAGELGHRGTLPAVTLAYIDPDAITDAMKQRATEHAHRVAAG